MRLLAFIIIGLQLVACGKPVEPPREPSNARPSEEMKAFASGEVVQFSSGSDSVSAELFLSKKDSASGLIVIHEWWGLNNQVRGEAKKLADEGYNVLAVDLYRGRVASDTGEAHELSRGLPEDRALRDLKAAFGYLSSRIDVDSIGVLGWCMGGGQALSLAMAEPRLSATIVYYGRLPSEKSDLARINSPVIGFFGEDDRGIPAADVRAFEATLKELGKEIEVQIYPGAGHAFANKESASYREEAAKDAWERTLKFLEIHL